MYNALYYSLNDATLQELSAGDLVLLRNSKRDTKKGDKMQAKWLGPYTVVASVGKGLYRIKNPSTDHVLKNAVHSTRLKQYLTADLTSPSQVVDCDTAYPPPVLDPNTNKAPPPSDTDTVEPPQVMELDTVDPPSVVAPDPLLVKAPETVDPSPRMDTDTVDQSPVGHPDPVGQSQVVMEGSIDQQLEEQLFSSSLLRLWRTGANYLIYSPEEDGDLDVRLIYIVIMVNALVIVVYAVFLCS